MKVGGTLGYSYGPALSKLIEEKAIDYKTARSDEINLKKLLSGRIDVFVCIIRVCDNLIKSKFTEQQIAQFTRATTPLMTAENHLIVSKSHKNAKEIIQEFNQGLKAIATFKTHN